jgi:hypothetical protein
LGTIILLLSVVLILVLLLNLEKRLFVKLLVEFPEMSGLVSGAPPSARQTPSTEYLIHHDFLQLLAQHSA